MMTVLLLKRDGELHLSSNIYGNHIGVYLILMAIIQMIISTLCELGEHRVRGEYIHCSWMDVCLKAMFKK